jgi:hypothetical protein
MDPHPKYEAEEGHIRETSCHGMQCKPLQPDVSYADGCHPSLQHYVQLSP